MAENFPNVIKQKVLQIHRTVNSTDDKNKENIPKHTSQPLKFFLNILKATRRKMTQHLQGNNDKND